jgi:hypothetical protein
MFTEVKLSCILTPMDPAILGPSPPGSLSAPLLSTRWASATFTLYFPHWLQQHKLQSLNHQKVWPHRLQEQKLPPVHTRLSHTSCLTSFSNTSFSNSSLSHTSFSHTSFSHKSFSNEIFSHFFTRPSPRLVRVSKSHCLLSVCHTFPEFRKS